MEIRTNNVPRDDPSEFLIAEWLDDLALIYYVNDYEQVVYATVYA